MKSRQGKAAKASLRRREQKLHRQEEILAAAFEVFAAMGMRPPASTMSPARRESPRGRSTSISGTRSVSFGPWCEIWCKKIRCSGGELPGDGGGNCCASCFRACICQVVRNDKVRSIVRLLVAESGRFPQLAEIYHREIIAPGIEGGAAGADEGIAAGEFRKTAALEFPQLSGGAGIAGHAVEIALRRAPPA